MIVSCYSAKCFPAHWKANVMLIISGEVTDACTPTHNCSHKGTLSKCWMELLIYQNGERGRTGPILEHADIPFQYSQKKRNGGKLRNQIVLYRALSSFLLKIVTVSIMPQTLSGAGVVSADRSFVWWKNVNPWGEQKPQECKWSTRNCSGVSESWHRQAGYSTSKMYDCLCQSCKTRFWQFEKYAYSVFFFFKWLTLRRSYVHSVCSWLFRLFCLATALQEINAASYENWWLKITNINII